MDIKKVDQKKRWLLIAVLAIIIAVQLGRIVYTFTQREGFHSDENWSYGFANSYGQMHVYEDADGVRDNYGEWTSGQVLRDYLEVNEGEGFNYASVYNNQRYDLSPPFHSMLLHTVCSFFPDTFSWWYSFSLNIIFFVLTQIALYFLGKEVTAGNRLIGVATVFFYGFTIGALNDFIYLRMYAFLTLLAVFSALMHVRLCKKTVEMKQIPKLEVILIILANFMGGFSHYYFLGYACFMTMAVALYLLIKAGWKKAFSYCIFMALSAALVFAVFPFAFSRVESGTSLYNTDMPYSWNLEMAINIVISEVMGFRLVYLTLGNWAEITSVIIFIIVLSLPLCFLFRNESWFISFKANIRGKHQSFRSYMKQWCHRVNAYVLIFLFTVFATLAVIAKISNIYAMGSCVDRYFFFLMPFVCLIFAVIFEVFARWLMKMIDFKKNIYAGVIIGLITFFLILNNLRLSSSYLFERNSDSTETIEALTEDADCLLVTNSDWYLTYFASRLLNTHAFFAMDTTECMDNTKAVEGIDWSRPVYLVLQKGKFKDVERRSAMFSGVEVEGLEEAGLDYSIEDYLANLESYGIKSQYIFEESTFAGLVQCYELTRE